MLTFLFAASFYWLSATAVANPLPTDEIGGHTIHTKIWAHVEPGLVSVAKPEAAPAYQSYTTRLILADSIRKTRASTVTIKVFAEKISQPLRTALVVIQSRATGKIERFTLLNGTLERMFTTPDELLIEVSADGYKLVKRSLSIAVSPRGNRYEFDAELAPVPITLTVWAVDSRTKKLIHDARFTIVGKANKPTLLLTPDSTTGLVKTSLPGRGIYQLTSSAGGYGVFTKFIKLDSIQSEARVMLTPETLPDVANVKALPEAVVTSLKPAEILAAQPVTKEPVRLGSIPMPAPASNPLGLPEKGKPVALRNIYFDQSSPVLRPESNPELDQLYNLLTQHPSMHIEIRGHTDNQGDFDANVQLSRDRCQAVVDYLVGKGIRKDRLKAIGRGPIDAIAPNNNEENRKKNRRVEFIPL